MKPLIIGMGPAKSYPSQAWHPSAVSTANLCHLICGNSSDHEILERRFKAVDLNDTWYRKEGSAGDAILLSDAERNLRLLIKSGDLRSGRAAFLLGRQVTNFVFAFLRKERCALANEAWCQLPKCVGTRLCVEDDDAEVGQSLRYYDFLAVPAWHPRTLTTDGASMPPGWQQKMMNALRASSGLPPMKFKPLHSRNQDPGH